MAFQRKKPAAIGVKAPYPGPGFIEPALASDIDKVPNGERWIHKIKFGLVGGKFPQKLHHLSLRSSKRASKKLRALPCQWADLGKRTVDQELDLWAPAWCKSGYRNHHALSTSLQHRSTSPVIIRLAEPTRKQEPSRSAEPGRLPEPNRRPEPTRPEPRRDAGEE